MNSGTGKGNSIYLSRGPVDFLRKFRNSSIYSRFFFGKNTNYFYSLFSKKARLLWLNIEFTSFCNLRCRMCSLDSSIPGGFMELAVLKKILNEIVSSPLLEVKNLSLWYGGETLLHPRFQDMLEAIASSKSQKKLFPYVTLLTNGIFMKGDKLEALLETGAVDLVLFSVDGGTKESFEYLRNGANWETLLNNIYALISEIKKRKLKIKTGLISIIENADSVSNEFKELCNSVDVYSPRQFHSWDGSTNLGISLKKGHLKKGFCYSATRQMAIHWNGNVSPCCMDLNQRGIIGNITNSSIYEIYHSPEREKIIEEMKNLKRNNLDFCRNCSN